MSRFFINFFNGNGIWNGYNRSPSVTDTIKHRRHHQCIKLLAGAKPYLPGLTVTFLLQKDLIYFNRFEKQMNARKVNVYTSWEYSGD